MPTGALSWLLDRLGMQSDPPADDAMQHTVTNVSRDMPDVRPVTMTAGAPIVGMPRGALAVTNPFTGNISYDPAAMQTLTPDEVGNTVAHELTHARQAQTTPWYQTALGLFSRDANVPSGVTPGSVLDNPYEWRPNELEAFQTERDRQMRQADPVDPVYRTRDINLPASSALRKRAQ